MIRTCDLTVATLLVAAVAAAPAAAQAGPGQIGPASGQTQNGRQLTPAGRLTTLGNFPTGGALTPDGRYYWAANSGHDRNSVSVVDVATGAVVQTLPLPGTYVGVAFAPDGRTAYLSGAATGDPIPEGPTKGGAGDEVHVFTVDPATGRGTEAASTINVAPPTPKGRARSDSLIPTAKVYPAGMDVSPDGKVLVVALNQGDQVALVDTATKAVRFVDVGLYPFGAEVSRDSTRAYITNELSGTVSVVELASGTVSATIPVGGPPGNVATGGPLGDFNSHPEGLALDPKRDLLYVAVANRDLVAVVNTTTNKAERFVSVGRATALGTSPVELAVTPDGRSLFVADANEDALAVIALTGRVAPVLAAKPGSAAAPGTRSRTVLVPRSIASILRYRTARVRAQRTYRAAQRRARTPKARAAVKRTLTRRLSRLRTTLLFGRRVRACSGPSRRADGTYRSAVPRAAQKRDAALRRAGATACPPPPWRGR